MYFANSKSCACLPFIPAPRKGRGQSSSLSADHVGYTRIPPLAYSETPPTLFHSRLNLKFYKACTEQRTHHSRPVLGALPYSPRQLGNSHADWYLLGSGLEVPTLPPLDLQHIPKRSAILLQCWRDSGGRISSGSRPGESLSTKRGGESAHEVWREGRGEAKFVRTCPGSQLPS